MVTHATVQAIRRLSGIEPRPHWTLGDDRWERFTQACDWTVNNPTLIIFKRQHAWRMIDGHKVDLPTCPTCLMFIDLALLESGLTCGENVEAA